MPRKNEKICPECGKTYHGHSEVSRNDSQMMICPDCGIRESLEQLGLNEEEREHILDTIHRTMRGEFDDKWDEEK